MDDWVTIGMSIGFINRRLVYFLMFEKKLITENNISLVEMNEFSN